MEIDNALNEEKDQIDKRFDSVLDRFKNADKVVEEHIDAVPYIEI